MGQQARQTALRLDWGRIVDAVEAEYTAAIAAPGALPMVGWKPVLPVA